MAVEPALMQAIAAARPALLVEAFADLTALGSIPVLSLILLGVWITDRDDALLGLAAVIPAGLATYGLKALIARPRPTVEQVVAVEPSTYSFPSGHATLAFAVAVLLARRNPRYAVYLYGVVALVALSRVVVGVHYPTDVLAGALVGTVAAVVVSRYDETVLARMPSRFRA